MMNQTVRIASLLIVLALAITSVIGMGPVQQSAFAAQLSQETTDEPGTVPEQQPEQPVAPEQPVTPEQPIAPEQPVAPEQPITPEQPVTPELPVAPEQPVAPVPPIALLPDLAINIPLEGETVSAVEVVVVGLGQGLPENSVVVQAKDANGMVLDGQPTTVNAPLGGAGEWRVILRPNVQPGTPGVIEAFSQSPATGEVVAIDTVNVTYGSAEPEPTPTPVATATPPASASIAIRIPLQDEVTSNVEVVVIGDGVSLPENNVVVQALDAGGVILDQTATTVDAPLGGAGEWRVILRPNVGPDTVGSILAFSTSPENGETIASDSVNVVFGASAPPTPTPTPEPLPAEPSIEITIPLSGETTSHKEVVVVGIGVGLPENNVVVEALDSSGRTLDKRSAIVDAEIGGEGEWRVTLYPDVAQGTQGRIVAYSQSPKTGAWLASDEVYVTFGQYMPPSNITIDSPREGSLVPTDRAINVSGRAQSIFENNVVVRIASSAGVVLAEQPTTANSRGEWSVSLSVPQVNTYANIIAFSSSPVDGSLDAYDQVGVQLIGPQPTPRPEPHIKIASPPNNSVVDVRHGFTVHGTASGTFENNVVVRILDEQGRVLRQIATRADANGAWNVFLKMIIANGAKGGIYAFSTSPSDGGIEAQDRVNVTFASACVPRTDWPVYTVVRGDTLFSIAQSTGSTVGELVIANCIPNPNLITVGQKLRVPQLPGDIGVIVPPEVVIIDPTTDDVLSLGRPVIMKGEAAGVTEGNVTVRALDNLGMVLDERRVEVTEPVDQDGTWLWQVDLDLFDAVPGSRGIILAYARSYDDGSILTADSRSVIYGEELMQPWVTIESPTPYSEVALEGVVSIVGRGGGLFENNVIVEMLDDVGNVLSVAPTTIETNEVGGSGFWEMNFASNYIGRGFITAYSTSPKDGSRVTEARIDVFFGDPTRLDQFIVTTYPLPNSIVTGAAPILSVVGRAGGIDPDQLRVVVMDANNRIIMSIPALVNNETDVWTVHLAGPLNITRDQMATIHVVAGAGAVSASDVVPIQVRQPAVTGSVAYLQRIALPPDAIVHVMVQNTSIADAPPEVTLLGEEYIVNPGQPPIPFEVKYNPAEVDPRFSYGVIARIEDANGRLLFINKELVQVLTQGYPSRNVEVIVEPVQ